MTAAMTGKTETRLSDEPVIRFTRIFDAPRALVWKAWTDPVHMAQWWGPKGFTNPVCKMDLRPGGLWHATMEGPDGGIVCPNTFIFDEIIAPERIVFRDITDYSKGWEQHTDIPRHAVHTVTFEELDGKTKMQIMTRLATMDDHDAMVRMGLTEGMNESLDRLADTVARLAGRHA